MTETTKHGPDVPRERRRGRRPQDAGVRRQRVLQALEELTSARVPFTMADVAERAGMSRATLYRDAGLRDLIGNRGDGPPARPVDARAHEALRGRSETQAEDLRKARRSLREAERRAKDAEARADRLEADATEGARAERAQRLSGAAGERMRAEAYAEGFAAGAQAARRGGSGRGPDAHLLSVAARLPRPALLAARRTLARALHPDLFAKDPAAALLATELLKQLNSLAGGTD